MVHNFFVAEWQTVCFYRISFNFHSHLNENSTHEVSFQLYNPGCSTDISAVKDLLWRGRGRSFVPRTNALEPYREASQTSCSSLLKLQRRRPEWLLANETNVCLLDRLALGLTEKIALFLILTSLNPRAKKLQWLYSRDLSSWKQQKGY